MSRPRPIETRKFWEKFLSVETENDPVCKISWMLRLRHMESRKFVGFLGWNQWWLGIRCQYKDSIKSLGQENAIFLHISSFQIVLWNLHSKFASCNLLCEICSLYLNITKFAFWVVLLVFGWFGWSRSTNTETRPHPLTNFHTHWNPSTPTGNLSNTLKPIQR